VKAIPAGQLAGIFFCAAAGNIYRRYLPQLFFFFSALLLGGNGGSKLVAAIKASL